MATTKDSATAHPPTRELRGLALYRDHGAEIEHPYPGIYVVPGCSGGGYVVHLTPRERCECPDFERHHEPCKHIYMAILYRAKGRRRSA